MFTGIIEEVGTIRRMGRGTRSSTITIDAKRIMEDLRIGDSVATNGVCLTVVERTETWFRADLMNETLKRSTFDLLRVGNKVNLERAMKLNDRFGGHIVSGHVDGIGTVVAIKKDENATWYTIKTSSKLLHYMVEKGSITMDGISLTVVELNRDSFTVSIIPHTVRMTTLSDKIVGSPVNLENDMIGKYVEKLIRTEKTLTAEYLKQHGF